MLLLAAAADEVLVELDPSEWHSSLEEAQALAAATERDAAHDVVPLVVIAAVLSVLVALRSRRYAA